MVDRHEITGLILAGGRGSRMGGADKGLALHDGRALALHALLRLAPQVGRTAFNANRHHDRYAAMGAPVWPDASDARLGPMAGFLAGLEHCETPWLLTVPCDAPRFPLDLASRLAAAIAGDADVAVAATRGSDGGVVLEPVFCLLPASAAGDVRGFLASGERKVERWQTRRGARTVVFDDSGAFANVNTEDDLMRLQAQPSP